MKKLNHNLISPHWRLWELNDLSRHFFVQTTVGLIFHYNEVNTRFARVKYFNADFTTLTEYNHDVYFWSNLLKPLLRPFKVPYIHIIQNINFSNLFWSTWAWIIKRNSYFWSRIKLVINIKTTRNFNVCRSWLAPFHAFYLVFWNQWL